jgi:hypothetical protein
MQPGGGPWMGLPAGAAVSTANGEAPSRYTSARHCGRNPEPMR